MGEVSLLPLLGIYAVVIYLAIQVLCGLATIFYVRKNELGLLPSHKRVIIWIIYPIPTLIKLYRISH